VSSCFLSFLTWFVFFYGSAPAADLDEVFIRLKEGDDIDEI